jgi:hypothetical protein
MSFKSAVECSITHKVDINLPNKFVPQLGERAVGPSWGRVETFEIEVQSLYNVQAGLLDKVQS